MQRRRERRGLARRQLIALYGGHRARQVLLLDRTVTDDDHFVHETGILFERDVQHGFTVVDTFVRLVSDVGEDERRTLLETDRITSVLIRRRTVAAVLLEDGDPDQRRPVLIADNTRQGQILCGCHDRNGTPCAKDEKRPAHESC